MKGLIRAVVVLGLVVTGPVAAAEEDGDLQRYMALQDKVAAACQADRDGDLCQVYLQGVLHGVQATGWQAEKLAQGWGELHEQAQRRHPYAWLARDILHASSCTPDAMAFLSSFQAAGDSLVLATGHHVAEACGPIWASHRLEAPAPRMIITQR